MARSGDNRSTSNSSAKSNLIALVLAAVLGGFVAFLVTQVQFTIEHEDHRKQATVEDASRSLTPSLPTTPSSHSSPATAIANGLRVSNQTTYPLRLVLLKDAQSLSKQFQKASAAKPTHWDFAPNEGSQNGLLLSLPKGKLRLEQGDILMAFALDGSRRYWGPYIVGETPLPTQSKTTKIWQLVFK